MFAAVLQPGDVFHHRMAGGGGWGDPADRDPEARARDVRNGKVSGVGSTDAARERRRRLAGAGSGRVRIARIEAIPLAIPLAQQFHWAGGAQVGCNLVLFAVHTDDGVVGWGESHLRGAARGRGAGRGDGAAARRPLRSATIEAILRSIWTEGRWKTTPQFTQFVMSPGSRSACWDALGRTLGVPTRTLFGGAVRDELDFFGFLQGDDPDSLAAHAGAFATATTSSTSRSAGRATTTRASPPSARRSGPAGCCGSTRTRPGTQRPRSTASGGSSGYDLDWVEQPTHARRRRRPRARAAQGRLQDRRRPGRLHGRTAAPRARARGGRRDRPGPHDAGGLLRFRQPGDDRGGMGPARQPARVHAERDLVPRARAGRLDDPEPDERQPVDAPAARRAADDRRRRLDAAWQAPAQRRPRPWLRHRPRRGRGRPRALATRRRLRHDRGAR